MITSIKLRNWRSHEETKMILKINREKIRKLYIDSKTNTHYVLSPRYDFSRRNAGIHTFSNISRLSEQPTGHGQSQQKLLSPFIKLEASP